MSVAPAVPLTNSEADALAECEAVISKGFATFVDVGRALLRIRDERLYRTTHGTFEDYCQATWSLSRIRAHQLIEASDLALTMVNNGAPPPANERQARELARVPEPQRAAVWQQTVERTNGKPTAAAVRETFEPKSPPLTEAEIDELRVENLTLPTGRHAAAEAPSAWERIDAEPGADDEAEDARRRFTASLGRSLVSLWALLDPNPGKAVDEFWRREHSVHIGLPLQAERFTATGIRAAADLLHDLADHLDSTGRDSL